METLAENLNIAERSDINNGTEVELEEGIKTIIEIEKI